MSTKIKITGVLTLLIIGGYFVFSQSSGSNLTGRLDSQVAFFKSSPEKDKVIDQNFVSVKSAASTLIAASLKAGRITQQEAEQFYARFNSDVKVTRADIATLAVIIFKLDGQKIGGPRITDVNPRERSAQAIYTCISNGCLDIEFKPTNSATWDFLNKVSANLLISTGK